MLEQLEQYYLQTWIPFTKQTLSRYSSRVKKAKVEVLKTAELASVTGSLHASSFDHDLADCNIGDLVPSRHHDAFDTDSDSDGYSSTFLLFDRGVEHRFDQRDQRNIHAVRSGNNFFELDLPFGFHKYLKSADRCIMYIKWPVVLVINTKEITVASLNDHHKIHYTNHNIAEIVQQTEKTSSLILIPINIKGSPVIVRAMNVQYKQGVWALVVTSTNGHRWQHQCKYAAVHIDPKMYTFCGRIVLVQNINRLGECAYDKMANEKDYRYAKFVLLNSQLKLRSQHTEKYTSTVFEDVCKFSLGHHMAFAISKSTSISIIICLRSNLRFCRMGNIDIMDAIIRASYEDSQLSFLFASKSQILVDFYPKKGKLISITI